MTETCTVLGVKECDLKQKYVLLVRGPVLIVESGILGYA